MSAAQDSPGPPGPPVIDAFVACDLGSAERPPWLVRVAEDYFKRAPEIFRDFEMGELLDLMDAHGVERSILTTSAHAPSKRSLAMCQARPDRFSLSVSVNPTRGMTALRELRALAAGEPLVLARLVPFMAGVSAGDAACWPLYAACVELGLPISVNTGIPGPPQAAAGQDPLLLDDVCLYFPELTLIMAHGADPWWAVAIRLMLKYPGLHLMTSAWAPSYLPAELLHYMRTRGRHKILFASDHPVLSIGRCVPEARALDLPADVLEGYLYNNARRVLLNDPSAPAAHS